MKARARRSTLRFVLAATLGLLLVALAAALAARATERGGLERLREAADHRLDVLVAELDGRIARFDYLPSLLELNPAVLQLLEQPDDKALAAEVNRVLEGINATAGAEMLYVLDRDGLTRAASDWNRPGTPLGENLAYRPYVRQALADGRGHFFGVGITSRRPGYYLSFALRRGGETLGLAAVKVSLGPAEEAWSRQPGDVLVLDERGIVVLASRPEWKYRPLAPIESGRLAALTDGRPYGAQADFEPLPWQHLEQLDTAVEQVRIGRDRYLADRRTLSRTGWQVLTLDPLEPLGQTVRQAALVGGLSAAVLLLVAVVAWQRRRAVRQQLASRAALQAAHDGLEAKVAERTAELQQSNRQLAEQIAGREAAEAELVHAGKLAALGQMSAGMVHELNQPLAALRTLSDNACVMLDRAATGEPRRLAGVRSNLERIAHLVDRLAGLTGQLKAFAHKAPKPTEPVSIAAVAAAARVVLEPRLEEHGVEFVLDLDPPDLAVPADAARLEQVLINLVGNAVDALASGAAMASVCDAPGAAADSGQGLDESATLPPPRVTLRGRRIDGERCRITIEDNGPGIRADMLPRLFEPFSTSKPAGSGLGLGLVIAAGIVRDARGQLRAANLPDGGACFTIELPCQG